MLKGKYTIVAFNSIGIPYSWDTNIIDMKEEHGNIIIIHKPKGKRHAFKHTYNKDNELKIFNGWLGLEKLFSNQSVIVSYDNAIMSSIKEKPIFSL